MDKNRDDEQSQNDNLEQRYDDLVHNDDSQGKSNEQKPQNDIYPTPKPIGSSYNDADTTNEVQSEQSISQPKFDLNKYFLYTLVAGLIISALISVGAVLIGEFNSTISRSLGTTVSMVIHTLLALWLISINNKSHKKNGNLLVNTLILDTVASFITSILSIWGVISGQVVGDLYMIYFYTFAASLWVRLLLSVGDNSVDKATRVVSYVAIGFTGLLYVLLIPATFAHYPNLLPDIYYRFMAASAILLATASVLTTVFHRIYVFKHPEVKQIEKNSSGLDVLIAVLVLIFGVPLIFGIMISLSAHNYANQYDTGTVDRPHPTAGTINRDDDRATSGSDEVTQDDINKYIATAGIDCTTQKKYSELNRDVAKGTVISINLQASIINIKYDTGTMIYARWKNNVLPEVVDKNCSQIQLTDIKAGDLISLYDGNTSDIYNDSQDVRVIQKLD